MLTTIKNVEETVGTVLRILLERLKDNPKWRGEYGPRTEVLTYMVEPPFDVEDGLPEELCEQAASGLLLQIREGGYETFVALPCPQAVDVGCIQKDKETGFSIRFVRVYNPISHRFETSFCVGVQK